MVFRTGYTQQSGTPAEVKAMFDRAIAALKADKTKALREFNGENDKQFHDRDRDVFCYNMSDGKFTAHPNPALMGTDTRTLRFKDDLPSDKEATTHLQARPKEALPRWSMTFQSPERVSPFQSNPLVRASVTKVVALATTNSRPGRATDHLRLVPTRYPTCPLVYWRVNS
jgi:hypothetical protein